MRINSVGNNVSFTKLHIPPSRANRLALEKFLETSPEALKETLADLDRKSGETHIMLKSGYDYGTGEILMVVTERGDNILTYGNISTEDETETRNGFKNLTDSYIETTLKKRPSKPKPNKKVANIINQYA